ncbi:Drug/Metabolite Transporter (DMT) Superfamily, partial [Pseudoloma neurophilia]
KILLLILDQIFSKTCKIDSDCQVRTRPDIHSQYCVDGKCQKLLGAGKHCLRPKDCASYFYFGPLACSARCKAESECEFDELRSIRSTFCCRAIPETKECNPNRPGMLTGCNSKHLCTQDQISWKCMAKNFGGWAIGVYLSIQGNLLINIGLNIQKLSYRMPNFSFFNMNISIFNIGLLIYIIGKVSGFLSYIFGNSSLLASLGSVGLIANSVFAPLINSEIFTWKDFMSIVFVLTGNSIILMNSGRSHKTFSLCELLKMYQRKETIIWFSVILIFIFAMFLVVKLIEVNSEWAFEDDFFSFLQNDRFYFEETGRILKYTMIFLYVALSGTIASFTTLFAKSFGEMVDQTILGDNQFLYGVTYLFFTNIVIFTALQIYWLNKALRHYDALLVIPLFFVFWTFFSIITAGIYFQDFEYYTWEQLKGFLYGFLLCIAGSGFLMSRVINTNRIVATGSRVNIEA